MQACRLFVAGISMCAMEPVRGGKSGGRGTLLRVAGMGIGPRLGADEVSAAEGAERRHRASNGCTFENPEHGFVL
jgi:hypothetical protein